MAFFVYLVPHNSLAYLNLLWSYSRSADATVHMFDRRNLASGEVGSPVHKFEGHNAAVLCVQVAETFRLVFFTSHLPSFIVSEIGPVYSCCYL